MARDAVADGIKAIAATPHVRDDYPTKPAQMEEGLVVLREALREAGVDLCVLPGGEIALDRLGLLDQGQRRQFGLGGNPRALLLEFPYEGWPLALPEIVFRLVAGGTTPILAHPERSGAVQRDPARLEPIVRSGALVQLTAASLDGRLGKSVRDAGLRLLDLGLAHLVASDAHSPDTRSGGLRRAAEAVGSESLAQWLTQLVPGAIVTGHAIPPRPSVPARRRRLRDRSARRN